MPAELEDPQTLASGTWSAPSGLLRVAIPVFYGKRFVLPRLAELLCKHPRLPLDARLSDQYVDIVREGLDIAQLPDDVVADALAAGRLVGLLGCCCPPRSRRTW